MKVNHDKRSEVEYARTTNHTTIPAILAVRMMNIKTGQAWSNDVISFLLETLLFFSTAIPRDSTIEMNGSVSNVFLP